MKYEKLGGGFIKKRDKRVVGLFIDGTGLDRATRRINRKVDMAGLVRGVTSGINPVIARYYTLVPYEDDSRQRAFLDAVARAGLSVIVKRLPPKGITRQVSVDLEMAADMVAFAHGLTTFTKENEYMPVDSVSRSAAAHTPAQFVRRQQAETSTAADQQEAPTEQVIPDIKTAPRSIVVVCPSRELAYPLSLVKDIAADTTTADFGQFNTGDVLKSAQKWIDLSDSETIWRD